MSTKTNDQASPAGLDTPVSEFLQGGIGEQNGLLRLIADAMPALISYVDAGHRYRFINKEYENWFGLEREKTVGRSLLEVLGEEAQNKVEPYVRRALGGEDVRFEAEIQYRKAGWKWVEARYIPDFDDNGGVRGFFALVVDITERKALEAKTLAQFEELENIYSSVPVGLAVIDTELRFVRVNEWLAALNGRSAAEHAGQYVGDVVPQLAEKAREVLRKVLETGAPVRDVIIEGEAPGQPSVQRAWKEIWTPVKDVHGETIAVSIVVEDITESRWAESLMAEQNRLFAMIAAGRPLATVLTELTAVIDRLQPSSRSAVLVADRARCKFEAAYAANIPETYTAPLRGVKIEKTPVGTCCEAVFRGVTVTSTDVAADTRWTDGWRELCLSHGIKACHSEPILGEDGRPLGTVVLGFDTPRDPDDRGLQLVRLGAQVAGVAIDRTRAEATLRLSEERLRLATAAADIYTWEYDPSTGVSVYSPNMRSVLGFELPTNTGNANLYIHPHDRDRVLGDFAACLDGHTMRSEYRYVDPASGNTTWVATHGALAPNNGRPSRVVGITQNITERKLAEDRARASERENFETLESITDAFFGLDSEWRFRYTNRQAEVVLGRERGSLIGKVIWDEYPGLFGSKFEAAFRRAMDARESSTLTDYYPDHQRWYEVHVYPRHSSDGTRGVSVYFRNVTERVVAEQAIRESERTFRRLVEDSPFGIYAVDADFRLASVSAGAQKVFENVRPLIGRDFAEVLRVVWEEPFATEAIEIFRHTLETGETYHAPRTVETRGDIGEIEAYDWKVERITMPDGRPGVVCHFYDLSERIRYELELAEAELRFRSTFEQAAVGIAQVAPDGRWMLVNDRLCEIVGYSREELLGLTFQNITHPDDLKADVEQLRRALAGETNHYATNKRYIRKGGDVVWANLTVSLVRDTDGSPKYFVSVLEDITDRKRTEAALRASEERYRFLDALGEATRTAAEPAAVMAAATKLLGEHLGVTRCAYADVDVDNDRFTIRDDWRAPGATTTAGVYSLDLFGTRAAADMRTGRALVVRDVDAELEPEDGADTFNSVGIKAIVCFPLVKEGRLRAMMAVHNAEPRDWTDDEVALVGETAERSWAHIERIAASAALRESEERFRNMADNAPVMIWVTEPDGYCTYLSQSWYDFTGQTPAEGLGYGWLKATHPDDAKMAEEIFRESNAKCEPFRAEYRLRSKTGEYRWAIDSAQPRFSESGVYLGYIGSVIDIHERKEAEEQRRRDRERFDIVRDGAEVGFWFCDLPFDELIWDNRVKEHFWLPPDARVTIDTFYDRIHPDDRERTREAIAASNANRTQYDIEYRTVEPESGREKWIRAIGRTFYNRQGEPIRFDGVTLDITDRKVVDDALRDSEELLASTFSGVEAAVAISEVIDGGREYRILNVNRACAEWTGIPVEDWVGKRLHEVVPEATADAVTERYRTAVENGGPVDYEEMVTMPSGDIWALTTVTPLRNEQGEINRVVATSVNITKRKEAEKALKESEERYRTLFETMDEGFCVIELLDGPDGPLSDYVHVEVNPAFAANTGIDSIVGLRIREAIPEEADGWVQIYRQVLLTGKPVRFERELFATGRRLELAAFRLEPAERRQIAVLFKDITAARRAEEALRKQTELLRGITESTPDLIYAKDASGRMIMANKATLEAMGQTEETAIGRLDSELYDPMEADLIMANDRRVMQTGRTETIEEVVTTNGDTRTYLTTKNPLRDADGRVIGVVGVSHDITALKRAETALRESEMRHRLALESGNMGTWTMPLDGGPSWADERTLALFDIPPEEWTGDAALIRARRLPEDQEAVNRTLAKAIAERSTWRAEFRVRRRDGSIRWLAGVGRIEFGPRGEPVMMRGINFDITERKQAEEELRSYHEILEATVRERTRELAEANSELKRENRQRRHVEVERQRLLAQLVAAQEQERRRIAQDLHDHLGQQLTALNLKLELALRAAADAPAAEHLQDARAMMRQIDDDVDALAWQLRPAILDDDGFLPALRKYVEDWSLRCGIPAEVWADGHFENRNGLSAEAETSLYRITQEALNNVAKYARAERVEVLLNKRGDSAVLTVQDDGTGFDVAAAAARTEKSMGLIGMRERAGLVGGTFQVESSPGGGTAVYVRVPFSASDGPGES